MAYYSQTKYKECLQKSLDSRKLQPSFAMSLLTDCLEIA